MEKMKVNVPQLMKAEIRTRKKFLTVSGACSIDLLRTLMPRRTLNCVCSGFTTEGDLNFCVRSVSVAHCGSPAGSLKLECLRKSRQSFQSSGAV